MLGTAYLIDHTCYILCLMYASRGIYKVRNKSWLNDLYGEDNVYMWGCASIHPIQGLDLLIFQNMCNYIIAL